MSLTAAKAAAHVVYLMNEASGAALDEIGSQDLTDNNTVGSAAGKFGNARDFERSNTEHFSDTDSTVRRGDQVFSGWAWVQTEDNGVSQTVMKGYGGSGWVMDWRQSTGRWRFEHDGDGTGVAVFVTETPSNGVWKLVMWFNDSANNLRGLSIDGAAFTTAGTGAGNGSTNLGEFQVGAFFTTDPWDGLIDECGVLHDYVWTDQDAADLWDGGTGVAFADWDAAPPTTNRRRRVLMTAGRR